MAVPDLVFLRDVRAQLQPVSRLRVREPRERSATQIAFRKQSVDLATEILRIEELPAQGEELLEVRDILRSVVRQLEQDHRFGVGHVSLTPAHRHAPSREMAISTSGAGGMKTSRRIP